MLSVVVRAEYVESEVHQFCLTSEPIHRTLPCCVHKCDWRSNRLFISCLWLRARLRLTKTGSLGREIRTCLPLLCLCWCASQPSLLPYNTVPCPTVPYYTLSGLHSLPYHPLPRLAIPWHTVPNHTVLNHTAPNHAVLNHTVPNHTILYHAIPSRDIT